MAYLLPFIEAEKLRTGDVGKSNGKIIMATVKGDVHDIGKNIVGVVLACNNFDVVDLGVMVSAQVILDRAREENADLIGLSGLITPSLEEMSHVAREMQRQGFDIPLLIGGATTSRAHTALKIDPHYTAPTVWVKDASRAVGVAQSLISRDLRQAFVAANDADYAEIRARHRNRGDAKRLVSLEKARAQRFDGDWGTYTPPAPRQPGIHVFDDYPLQELIELIDWTPFFQAWELAGKFPAILSDEIVGTQASELYRDARRMLKRIVEEKWLTAKAVFGLWPANSVGDDVEVILTDPGIRKSRLEIGRSKANPEFPIPNPGNSCTSCANKSTSPSTARISAWPISSLRKAAARRTGSAPSRSLPASVSMRMWPGSKPRTTTTIPSCSRLWPTVWQRHWPSACINACAPSSGVMSRTKRWTTKP